MNGAAKPSNHLAHRGLRQIVIVTASRPGRSPAHTTVDQGSARGPQHRGDLDQHLLLLGDPVQGVERHHDVEVLAERQRTCIGDHEPGPGVPGFARGAGGRDHPLRRVHADRIAAGHYARHLVGQEAVAASHVEHPVCFGEREARLGLLDHRALKRADLGVVFTAPVGHLDS